MPEIGRTPILDITRSANRQTWRYSAGASLRAGTIRHFFFGAREFSTATFSQTRRISGLAAAAAGFASEAASGAPPPAPEDAAGSANKAMARRAEISMGDARV